MKKGTIKTNFYLLPEGSKRDVPCLRKGEVVEILKTTKWDDGDTCLVRTKSGFEITIPLAEVDR